LTQIEAAALVPLAAAAARVAVVDRAGLIAAAHAVADLGRARHAGAVERAQLVGVAHVRRVVLGSPTARLVVERAREEAHAHRLARAGPEVAAADRAVA